MGQGESSLYCFPLTVDPSLLLKDIQLLSCSLPGSYFIRGRGWTEPTYGSSTAHDPDLTLRSPLFLPDHPSHLFQEIQWSCNPSLSVLGTLYNFSEPQTRIETPRSRLGQNLWRPRGPWCCHGVRYRYESFTTNILTFWTLILLRDVRYSTLRI